MKLIALADTHGCHNYIDVPDGDILIHCGDAELDCSPRYVSFLSWFQAQPHKHKIFVPGNHDFEMFNHQRNCTLEFEKYGISCLIDKEIVINGVKFYGTPWVPKFFRWAFMKDDCDLKAHWDMIPDDTKVLITHGPAYNIGDQVAGKGKMLGSKTLNARIKELNDLKLHLWGHIHTGIVKQEEHELGFDSINCSILNESYKIVNTPKIISLDIIL